MLFYLLFFFFFFFFFKQKTAYEMRTCLEFRRVLFRSSTSSLRVTQTSSNTNFIFGKEEKIVKSKSPTATYAFNILLASVKASSFISSLKKIGIRITAMIINKKANPVYFRIFPNKDFLFFSFFGDINIVLLS